MSNELDNRRMPGSGNDMSFGPFAVDLCTQCYDEFRTVVADWLDNDIWSEVDGRSHSDEHV